MARSRAIAGALNGFLGTFTSRYSDYDGYWIFGFLVSGSDELTIDLAFQPPKEAAKGPFSHSHRLAIDKFKEQVEKAGLEERLAAAQLTISRQPERRTGLVNGRACDGHDVLVRVVARMDTGRDYQRERTLFVAAHDQSIELRSARADD